MSVETTTAVMSATKVSKHFGGVVALHEASIEVHPHEIVALVGDNGAGKSTLISCITGALQPDSGSVVVDGMDVTHAGPKAIRLQGVETVYQGLALPPDLSCAAGIFLGREIHRKGILGKLGFIDWPKMRSQARDKLKEFGIDMPKTSRIISTLSGGQRQSVAITRAVMWGSKMLVLDEPTAALGVVQTKAVLETVMKARDAGIGVLLISHNVADVMSVADRIVVLRLGKVVATLKASETSAQDVVAYITGAKS
jgi:simple sugar transport system ATP-binding protein